MDAMAEPARSDLRPQRFGRQDGRRVKDPLIEPIWVGERVLAHVELTGPRAAAGPFVAIQDEDGELLEGYPEVAAALAEATLATSLVLDGYLTDRVERGPEGPGPDRGQDADLERHDAPAPDGRRAAPRGALLRAPPDRGRAGGA